MILRRLWLLASFVLSVFADVKFTKPEPGATIEAGGTLTIEWEESGESPSLDSLLSYQLFLCAGGNDDGTFVGNFNSLLPKLASNNFTDPSQDPGSDRVILHR